jgi:transposase
MHKTDARRLRHGELTELRKRAVAAVQKGESPEVLARAFGVTRAAMYGWLARYRAGGWGALDAQKRGGRRPKLAAKQIEWIYRVVTVGDPRQYTFPFALWTSRMLQTIIAKHLGVELSKASVCRLLNQLGLSPQRPLWRAYQQDPEAVERWVHQEYPRIRRLAQSVGAEIWFGDEAGVRSDAHAGTTWALRGKTPIISTTGARFGLNLISAVSRRGDFRFMCVKGRVNAKVFVTFLHRLLHGVTHPIFLVVDGHPTHKAACVHKLVDSTEGRLRLFLLPPYSPELNPDEHVWNDLKNNGIGKKVITAPHQMKRDVISYLRFLQKSPARIRSFFKAPTTAYAG